MGKKTQWVLAFAVMVVALISVTAAAVSAKPTTTEHHTTKVVAVKKVVVKQADPYENLSTQRQKVVKAADLAAIKVVNAKLAEKSADEIASLLTDATTKATAIEGADNDTTSLRETFTNILAVVKTPNTTTLKTARSSMTLLFDATLAKHLTKTYETKLIKIVAKAAGQSTNTVRDASQPMSAEEFQAKQDAASQAEATAVANAATNSQADTQTTEQTNTTAQPTQTDTQTTGASDWTTQVQSTYTAPTQTTTTQATQPTSSDTQAEQTTTTPTSDNSTSNATPTTTDSTAGVSTDATSPSQTENN